MYRYGNPEKTVIYSEESKYFIPISEGNSLYQDVLKWIDEGNQIGDYIARSKTWDEIRTERDRLLTLCDWVVVKSQETGVGISTEWTNYRQALRDITSQSNPNVIIWPEKPTE